MMKKIFVVSLLTLALCSTGVSQTSDISRETLFGYRYGIGGGMGVSAVSIHELFTYINQSPGVDPQNRLSEFSTAIEFFLTMDLFLQPQFAVGMEYSYLFGSHNFATVTGSDDFFYSYHLPLLLGHYLVAGSEFFFKFGGGLGYIFARYVEDLATRPEAIVYTGGGIGGKAQAVGHTPFGDNLFAYIGAEMRFGFPGSVTDSDGRPLQGRDSDVSFNFFSFGLKFGLMYYF